MACYRPDFDEIQIIMCVQGYALENQFIIRELGYWTREKCGVVPFNCKLNKKLFDSRSLQTINYLEERIHGIKVEKKFEYGLPSGEFKTVLKTLYHTTKIDNIITPFIGVCRDENIIQLLYKTGLGKFVYDLDNLEILKENQLKCPSNKDLKNELINDSNNYKTCFMHDKLMNNEIPLCAKVKSKFIADFISNLYKSD